MLLHTKVHTLNTSVMLRRRPLYFSSFAYAQLNFLASVVYGVVDGSCILIRRIANEGYGSITSLLHVPNIHVAPGLCREV